jgi:hypothetical protein
MSEQKKASQLNLRVDRALIDAAIRKAVREEVLSNARLGFPVCTLRDGKVVWLSPQEIFEQFANEPAPQQ